MSKPRYHPPSVQVWMVGSKCVDDQFHLAPTPEARMLIMLFLAKMQELHTRGASSETVRFDDAGTDLL